MSLPLQDCCGSEVKWIKFDQSAMTMFLGEMDNQKRKWPLTPVKQCCQETSVEMIATIFGQLQTAFKL